MDCGHTPTLGSRFIHCFPLYCEVLVMKLLDWAQELPLYIEDAVKNSQLKVVLIKGKTGDYEILQGEVKVGTTIISFK